MDPERYQKKVAMAQAASAANAEKDASKSPTPAAVPNKDNSASMASASAPMASASKKNLEGEKKDVSPDMSDDDENMPTLDDEELAAAISLGFGNAEVNTNRVTASALALASPTIQLYNQRIAEKYRKKNLEGTKKDVSPDIPDDDENMPTLKDEELAAAISLGFGNAEVNTSSVAASASPTIQLYNQRIAEKYRKKNFEGKKKDAEKLETGNDVAAAWAAAVASASDENGPLYTMNQTRHEEYLRKDAQADNIVAIGKNVTPDGGDGDKKMPALDDEEIAKAISASENNMLDRLLEKEMDGDEEMQGKTVRQMAANDSQDGSRKMLPASTAQGEASASMASASPWKEDNQIREESHKDVNRKFPAPSDVASAAEAHKLTAGQITSKNSSLDVKKDAVKLSTLDDKELALAISASVGNSPVAQKRETKTKIPGERVSVIDQIMEEDEEFQVFKRQFHGENSPRLITQEMMIQNATNAISASVGNSSAETDIERNIIDQMASAAGQASSTAPSAETIPENVLCTSDAARSSIAPNNPQTRPAGATVVRNPLNTQASEIITLFVTDAEIVRPPSLDDPLDDALEVIDKLSSAYLELGPATVSLSMLRNALAAAVACCDDAIDVQPSDPPLVEDAPLGDALKFLARVSEMYREFGIERVPIPDVREALVKAMVRCEDEMNRPPVSVKINAGSQGKKFLILLITLCLAVIVGVTLVLLLRPQNSPSENENMISTLLKYIGEDPEMLLSQCEGDCDTDAGCSLGLLCFQREEGGSVPGCGGDPTSNGVDYCIRPEDAPSAKPSTEPSDSPSVRPSFSLSFLPTTGIKASLDTSIELVKDAYGGQVPPWKDAETNKKMRESGQFRAVQWCAENNVFNLGGTLPLTLFSLASFFYGSGGDVNSNEEDSDVWTNSEGWLDIKKGHCTWFGIECVGSDIKISLESNKLEGTLAPEIFLLPHITGIDLDSNSLSGPIPSSVGLAKDLDYFYVEENKFSGSIPDELYTLPKIREIWLGENQITGSISPKLSQLTTIEKFHVFVNRLGGTLNNEMFSNLTNLRFFSVDGNSFSGTLPAELFDLPNLEDLRLRFNQFTGTIPNTISNLKNLRIFYIEDNRLSGTIPKDIGECVSLVQLDISNQGSISGTIPESLYNLRDLIQLSIYNNAMTGTLSNRIGEIDRLVSLSIRGNDFTGTLPATLGTLTYLKMFWAYENSFSGQIPEELGQVESLETLELHSNKFSGTVPDVICVNLSLLSKFTTDCKSLLECSCCTRCD